MNYLVYASQSISEKERQKDTKDDITHYFGFGSATNSWLPLIPRDWDPEQGKKNTFPCLANLISLSVIVNYWFNYKTIDYSELVAVWKQSSAHRCTQSEENHCQYVLRIVMGIKGKTNLQCSLQKYWTKLTELPTLRLAISILCFLASKYWGGRLSRVSESSNMTIMHPSVFSNTNCNKKECLFILKRRFYKSSCSL